MDFLKDERRKEEKVLNGKTRLISAVGLDLLVLFKVYFGDFIRFLRSNKTKNGLCTGINPTSSDWNNLVDHMHEVGKKH